SDTSILLKNIPKYDIPFFEIKYFNSNRTDGFSYSFPLNDRPSGVVHTTDALYNVIHPWTASNMHIMDTLFLANTISDPEAYAFLQDFYEIPPQNMDSLIGDRPSYPP